MDWADWKERNDEAERALRFAHQHDWGSDAVGEVTREGKLRLTGLTDVYSTGDGESFTAYVSIPATMAAVRAFGGY